MLENDKTFQCFDILKTAERDEAHQLLKIALENLDLYNFDINSVNERGETLLHIFARKNSTYDLCKKVLDLGINPNRVNYLGESALHFACSTGNIKIIQLLVARGALIDIQNKNNETPLVYALKNDKFEIVKLFSGKLSQDKLLEYAIIENNLAKVKFLLDNNHTTNLTHYLQLAVKINALPQIVQRLIERGANANKIDWKKKSLLHISVENRNRDLATLLVCKGCNVNAKSDNGETALHVAVRQRMKSVTLLLLNHRVALNATDEDGYTALHVAATVPDSEFVKLLLQHKADERICTDNGDSALHLAASYGNLNNVKLLLNATRQLQRNRMRLTPVDLARGNHHGAVVIFLAKRRRK